ncbi:MAG TPA: 4Fe-4S binding protein [Bacillota bacterium]|nr:4Fe-4S binding protein [Bacillota bacterium]HOH10846.1 4Fe-4S binding protein [Bacillota bacterium]HOY88634.1 4Fe-4S binding protein [Bacillota bacterium]HPI00791.1 4Fe-4S binding protein [Bacillota bacterium]HPM63974.1 4Fe-4S binding protein [Bacillota bacterium]
MSKGWYPVIDYARCIECGNCTDLCRHGVYDKAKAPFPVVVHPDGCIQGCHGCGRLCPVSAISYVGDVKETGQECSCSTEGSGCDCGCEVDCDCE